MARINKKNIISGRIANLVFRNVEGKQIVQSRPEEMKQTLATKLSSSEFTQCSRWAKNLRLHLQSFLVGHTDTYMYKRLTSQTYKALQLNTGMLKGQRNPRNADMSALVGFEFNTHSLFGDYFLPEITASLDIERRLNVILPEFEPKTEMVFAKKTFQAELVVFVIATNFEPNTAAIETHFVLPFAINTALVPETRWISDVLPANYFVMATAKLMFYSNNQFMGKNYANHKELNPAIVIFAGGAS